MTLAGAVFLHLQKKGRKSYYQGGFFSGQKAEDAQTAAMLGEYLLIKA